MVLFNKQGKWFPPITHKPPKSCPAKDRDIPEFSGNSLNLDVPKDAYLFNRDGSSEIWTVSELRKHASCLWFTGWAKPLALNWNATRTIYNNWCFLRAASAHWRHSWDSFACCLQLSPSNFKRSDGVIPKMSSDFGPQRQQNLCWNLAQAANLYCCRNILMNNNNWFLYSLVVCVNQKIPLGLNNAQIWKTNGFLICSYCYLVGFYWPWHLVEGILRLHIIKSLLKRMPQLTSHITWHILHLFFFILCFVLSFISFGSVSVHLPHL